jgi:alpha-mannosidase
MVAPGSYPRERFQRAWRNVLLFSEHTWGAHNSVSQPESEFALSLWKVKQAFAEDATRESKALLAEAVARLEGEGAFQIINTNSWARSDLVVLPEELTGAGDVVRDGDGAVAPSQRLKSGGLAFIARDVPPFGSRKFTVHAGRATTAGGARVEGTTITNGILSVTVDPGTGELSALRWQELPENLVDRRSGSGLNAYLYLPGKDPAAAVRSGKASITLGESGPLVASLVVDSEAPGCRGLRREIRVVDGLRRVDIINIVDKEPVRSKESVHFGFPFAVPDGQVRIDGAWAVVRPNEDQLEGANRNVFPVQRWVDISGTDQGVTLATIDAPLVELGAVHAEAWSLDRSRPWIRELSPTQTVYSYVMNNYWHTNYKAYQEGRVTFRYSLLPHGAFNAAESKRFGIERSQPLIRVSSSKEAPELHPLLTIDPDEVLVSSVMPIREGTSLRVRLYNPMDRTARVHLQCRRARSTRLYRSNSRGEKLEVISGRFPMGPRAIVTVRVEPEAGDHAPRG